MCICINWIVNHMYARTTEINTYTFALVNHSSSLPFFSIQSDSSMNFAHYNCSNQMDEMLLKGYAVNST